jgi:Rieske 2Fe-2S family protein
VARLVGLYGRPYLDLRALMGDALAPLDDDGLREIDDEVTRALVQLEPGQTGGSLKSMGICAPNVNADPYVDYGDVIARFTLEQWRDLVALADDPTAFDERGWRDVRFGDETNHPLNARQIRWLTYRHGVYFPWKVCVHLLENVRWDDKHSGDGKDFTDEAKALFPRTLARLRALPFTELGRVVLFGLLPNDHAPLHRDSEPGRDLTVAQSLSIDPRGDKRFFLSTKDGEEEVDVEADVYWFNDMDFHGVRPDPRFRYSIRIDGTYDRGFLRELARRCR